MISRVVIPALCLVLCFGCEKKDGSTEKKEKQGTEAPKTSEKSGPVETETQAPKATGEGEKQPEAKPAPTPTSAEAPKAELGKPAPDFTLTGVDGKTWKLSDQRGKVVVLEWFNPECPFVVGAHTKGQLKTSAADLAKKGVVWVAINSNAEGKQGFGKEKNLKGQKDFGLSHPILLDPTGAVGRQYRATRTPHMMVVDAEGKLAYRGALDNTGGGDAEDAPMGVVVNYVEKAANELLAGKPVTESEVRPWGCGVKYAK